MTFFSEPKMKRSVVVFENGTHGPMEGRTSYSAVLEMKEDPVIQCIKARAGNFTSTPDRAQESLQVVRYYPGQTYYPHWDFFPHESMMANPYDVEVGPRSTTFLVYLNDEKDGLKGGETDFPRLDFEVDPKKNSART